MEPVLLRLPLSLQFTDEQYQQLVAANPSLKLERTAQGLAIAPLPLPSPSARPTTLTVQLQFWSRRHGGIVLDDTQELLWPDGSRHKPSAGWISQTRWDDLPPEARSPLTICPDLVVEVRSPRQALEPLQAKMPMYLDQGGRLGWLIDPIGQQVEIYRVGQEKEVRRSPRLLLGEDILPQFVLNLQPLLG